MARQRRRIHHEIPRVREARTDRASGRPNRRSECRRGPGLSNCPTEEVERGMARVLDRSSGRPSCAIGAGGARHAGSLRDASRAGHCPGRGCSRVRPENFAGGRPLDRSPAQSEAAAPASDETCRQDEDRLEHLSTSPTADGVLQFLIELRCEKLRPRLLSLAEQVDDKAPPAAADPAPSVPSSVLPEKVVLAPPLPPPRMRATEHQKRTPTILASRGVQRKRHANARTAPNLPQLLLALFGEGSRNSTAARRSHTGGAGSSGGGN